MSAFKVVPWKDYTAVSMTEGIAVEASIRLPDGVDEGKAQTLCNRLNIAVEQCFAEASIELPK